MSTEILTLINFILVGGYLAWVYFYDNPFYLWPLFTLVAVNIVVLYFFEKWNKSDLSTLKQNQAQKSRIDEYKRLSDKSHRERGMFDNLD